MGWFWGPPKDNDPVKSLDPALKEFLQKETPEKYVPAEPSSELSQSSLSKVLTRPDATQPDQPVVPPQSLFQDGRYAHLWKTYVPLEQIEAAQNTDKMRQVVDLHKMRQNDLAKAALENCAEEHQAVTTCFSTGGLRARLTMCKQENTKFGRCYDMQTKFLRALGYASMMNQEPEMAERIQMHADTLYHRMLDYERNLKDAKEKGLPEPTYESVFNDGLPPIAPDNLPQRMKEKLKAPLSKMAPHEREVEIRAMQGEIKVLRSYSGEIEDMLLVEKLSKQRRKEKMAKWVGQWAAEWLM